MFSPMALKITIAHVNYNVLGYKIGGDIIVGVFFSPPPSLSSIIDSTNFP